MSVIIITENPVINGNDVINPQYMNFSGTNKSDIMDFQDWLDANYPTWANGKRLNKGAGYGNYGSLTKKANAKYGKAYDAYVAQTAAEAPDLASVKDLPPVNKNSTPPASVQAHANKLGYIFQKGKGWVAKGQGLLGKLKGLAGGAGMPSTSPTDNTPTDNTPVDNSAPDASTPKTGMSKGLKIGLIVGGSLLLITAIYLAAVRKPATK